MTRHTSYSFFGILAVAVIGLFPFPAFAAPVNCGTTVSVYTIFCNIYKEFVFLPAVMSVLCYVGGIVMTMIALLNLRAYGDDPSSMPLRSIVMKFIPGAMLISIPLAMNMFAKSVLGSEVSQNNEDKVYRPCSYSDSNSLLSKRGSKKACCGS